MGFFITFEGVEGCGKTTQIRNLSDRLTNAGYRTVLTREPGGCPIADKIRSILLDGMEQAMDTWLPEVTVHHQFKPFIEDVVPTLSGQGLIAHPEGAGTLAGIPISGESGQRLLLAVGPEGGWSDHELQCFSDHGFYGFTMGNRILHVDTAVVSLLAQLQLLYDLRKR